LVHGYAVSARGDRDSIVVTLRSNEGTEYLNYLPKLYPALSQYLGRMGFTSVPADGQDLKVCLPNALKWDGEHSPQHGAMAFDVKAVA
jgi:hypothetical protein